MVIACKDCSNEVEICDIVITYYPEYNYAKRPPYPKLWCGCCGKELVWGEDIIRSGEKPFSYKPKI